MTGNVTTSAGEWAEVILDLGSWKPLTPAEERDYGRALMGKFPPGVLLTSIRQLLHAGASPFRPAPAEIIREAVRVMFPELAPVSWTEVWSAINAARRHRDFPRHETLAERARWVGERVTAEVGPIAGAFAAATFADLQHAPVAGGERSGAAVASLRKEWDEHQVTIRERVLRGGRVLSPAEIVARGERVSPLQPADTTQHLGTHAA